MANEWCAPAAAAVNSNAIKTAGSKLKILFIFLLLNLGCALSGLRFALTRQRGVEDRIARLAREFRKERRTPHISEPFLARQLRTRGAVLEKVVAARLAFPVLHAMAGRFEFLRATKRIDGVDRFDERVLVVERDLNLEPLDVVRVLFQLPCFDRLELIARHRRPAREVG